MSNNTNRVSQRMSTGEDTQQQSSDNNNNNNNANSNFHVCVRIRPTSSPSFENQGHSEGTKYVRAGPENSILFVQPHSTQGDKVFIFDEVFDNKSKTKSIFEKVVRPNLLNSLFKGFSHTILVYGMTGSGKTFTMFGDSSSASGGEPNNNNNAGASGTTSTVQVNLGSTNNNNNNGYGAQRESNSSESSDVDGPLLQLQQQQRRSEYESGVNESDSKTGLVNETVKLILAQTSDQSMKTKVRMSYLEIYNEQIRDLLSSEALTSDNLMILEDPDKGVYCPLLSERDITTLEQISALIKQGNKRRVMASTKLNEFSSRSHAIIQLSMEIEIESNEKASTYFTPKLYMVDLAGSERASQTESKGLRLKEGANINKSLLSLGNCITVLSSPEKKKRHVPYRDSKLTRLLKESLGGNAKTLLIACVTPAFRFVEETINTLKYAQRAKSIHKDVYENIKQIYNQIEKKEDEQSLSSLQQQQQQQQQEMLQALNDPSLMFDASHLNQQQLLLLQSSEQLSPEMQALQGFLRASQQANSEENLSIAQMKLINVLEEGNFNEEELRQRLEIIQGARPSQEQVLRSEQFLSHKEKFREQFKKLSDHFEDIMYRNRELECNLQEFVQSKEQNEKLINEIMDTINPAAQTQKETKYRLDKVNMLRGIVKNNEDVIVKLQRELKENDTVKSTIKSQLASLYEIGFIRDCSSLTNVQLYSAFESEKQLLKTQINALMQDKQIRRTKDQLKEDEIFQLKEEIYALKRKAQENELLLQQCVADNSKNKTRGRSTKGTTNNNNNTTTTTSNNLRGSTFIPASSSTTGTATSQQQRTPRGLSQSQFQSQNNNQLFSSNSRNVQFQTFVQPSSSSSTAQNNSSSVTRNKSANLRQSMYNMPSSSLTNNGSNSNVYGNNHNNIVQQLTGEGGGEFGVQSMAEVHNNNRYSEFSMDQDSHTREFEEYKRKEYIIETQLKNLNKNSSQKNVRTNNHSHTYVDPSSSNSHQTYHSPNRWQATAGGTVINPQPKSSFKSSFVVAPPPPVDTSSNYNPVSSTIITVDPPAQHSNFDGSSSMTYFGGSAAAVTANSYEAVIAKNLIGIQQQPTVTSIPAAASDLNSYGRYVPTRDEDPNTFGEIFLSKAAGVHANTYTTVNPAVGQQTAAMPSNQFQQPQLSIISPKSRAKAPSGSGLFTGSNAALSYASTQNQSSLGISKSKHSKTPSYPNADIASLISAPTGTTTTTTTKDGFYAIPESVMEQSIMNMTGQIDYQPASSSNHGVASNYNSNGRRTNNAMPSSHAVESYSYGTPVTGNSLRSSQQGLPSSSSNQLQRNLSPHNRSSGLNNSSPYTNNANGKSAVATKNQSSFSQSGQQDHHLRSPITQNQQQSFVNRASENSAQAAMQSLNDSPAKKPLAGQQNTKIINPSFNSYMQNRETYGMSVATGQGSSMPANSIASLIQQSQQQQQQRVVQVPTTAISLDFNSK